MKIFTEPLKELKEFNDIRDNITWEHCRYKLPAVLIQNAIIMDLLMVYIQSHYYL